MNSDRSSIIVPVALIAVGAGWLLSVLGIAPSIDWVWTIGLAVVGLLFLATSGLNKLSVVFGPFFLGASLLSVLRQTGRLSFETEVPILVILVGVLMLIARHPAVPVPRWVRELPDVEKRTT